MGVGSVLDRTFNVSFLIKVTVLSVFYKISGLV